jgi:glycine cleavage system H protein
VVQAAAIGVIESVKAVSDLFAPLSGDVVESNGELADQPELLNSDPFGKGWMLRIKIADASQVESLLDAAGYDALTAEA